MRILKPRLAGSGEFARAVAMKRYFEIQNGDQYEWYGGYENGYLRRVGFEPRVETRRWSRSARTWGARCACEGRSSASRPGGVPRWRKADSGAAAERGRGGVSESVPDLFEDVKTKGASANCSQPCRFFLQVSKRSSETRGVEQKSYGSAFRQKPQP